VSVFEKIADELRVLAQTPVAIPTYVTNFSARNSISDKNM